MWFFNSARLNVARSPYVQTIEIATTSCFQHTASLGGMNRSGSLFLSSLINDIIYLAKPCLPVTLIL